MAQSYKKTGAGKVEPAPGGQAAHAPPASIATVPPGPANVLPVTGSRSARINTLLAARLFQSLDVLIVASAAVSGCMRASPLPLPQTAFGIVAPFLVLCFAPIWMLAASGAYRFEPGRRPLKRWLASLASLAAASIVTVLAAKLFIMPVPAFRVLVQNMAVALVFLAVLQGFYNALAGLWARRGALASTAVLVGATGNARRLIRQSAQSRDINIVAVFDDRASRRPGQVDNVPVAGGVRDLLTWPELHTIDTIIITVTSTASKRVNELIDQLRALPQDVVLFMDLDGFHPEQAQLAQIARAPMAYVSGGPRSEARAAAKRVQDIVFASAMLVIFAPVMALIALLIRLDSKGPVLFRQKRHGFNNRIIEVFKFRTMRAGSERGPIQQVRENDARVTRVGRFLRRTSLDELPQLFNVLGGSMSLVGPRPHAVGMRTGNVESWKLVAHYAHRHRVKPGITGWAQIHGSRGPLNTPEQVRERIRLDLEYIRRASFWLDVQIMLKTVPCLLGDKAAVR